MYWTIGQFPELRHLDDEERASVLRKIPWWFYPWAAMRSAALALCVLFVGAIILVKLGVERLNFRPPISRVAITFAIFFVLLLFVFYAWEMSRLRVKMRAQIVESTRGGRPSFCMECGYDLRASPQGHCPECGQPIAEVAGNPTRAAAPRSGSSAPP